MLGGVVGCRRRRPAEDNGKRGKCQLSGRHAIAMARGQLPYGAVQMRAVVFCRRAGTVEDVVVEDGAAEVDTVEADAAKGCTARGGAAEDGAARSGEAGGCAARGGAAEGGVAEGGAPEGGVAEGGAHGTVRMRAVVFCRRAGGGADSSSDDIGASGSPDMCSALTRLSLSLAVCSSFSSSLS